MRVCTATRPPGRVTTYSYDSNWFVQVLAPNAVGGVLTTAYDYDFGRRPVGGKETGRS